MKRRRRAPGGDRALTEGRKPPREDATEEVSIERIVPGGAGLAHANGQTIFVGLCAPGDRLRVEIYQRRGKASFASIREVIEPSPERIEPPCPYFGRCGGCDFQQLNYRAQLDSKVSIIRDCLRRIARIEPPEQIPITPSPLEWQYRSRAQWQYDPVRRHLGYFERGSHRVCDVVECPVIVPQLQEALTRLRERARDGSLPDVQEFQAVAGDEGASLTPPVAPGTMREVTRTIGEHRYRFDAEGFFQINHELLPSLIAAAVSDAEGEHAIDLYCGVGLFTLPLARRFARVTGVEADESAISHARSNLQDARLSNVAFHCARVSDWLEAPGRKSAPLDLILLDPPRAGVEEKAMAGILALAPRRIAYVSCDPATLARDLKRLIDGGYHLDSVAAFDLFPQTHHVETVAHLRAFA
ncbi:MAG TPA: class I SAM-dependent RNA methyltransferase [Pyrinomonadaceae bacterium]|jgi:tRNA/tmRNA/rRNA uracil-C5-methylase (TrmA/RlmC/RlmD family)|nr:class I SAM-dependent RNA methyltransferase [Pyrinomonadaceae bacterium]